MAVSHFVIAEPYFALLLLGFTSFTPFYKTHEQTPFIVTGPRAVQDKGDALAVQSAGMGWAMGWAGRGLDAACRLKPGLCLAPPPPRGCSASSLGQHTHARHPHQWDGVPKASHFSAAGAGLTGVGGLHTTLLGLKMLSVIRNQNLL